MVALRLAVYLHHPQWPAKIFTSPQSHPPRVWCVIFLRSTNTVAGLGSDVYYNVAETTGLTESTTLLLLILKRKKKNNNNKRTKCGWLRKVYIYILYIYSLYVLFCGSKYNNTGYDNGAERRNKVRPKTVVITSFPRRFSILIADDVKSAYYIYI